MDDTQGAGLMEAVGQLLAVLAHEIRNPLANIANSVVLLEREPQDTNLVLNCTEIIKRQARRISQLTNDLFDVTLIDQGKMGLSRLPMSVNGILRLAVEDSTCEMEFKQHHFTLGLLDEDAQIFADESRILQVFCNLLANAAKYTPQGGDIAFKANVVEDQVVFSIQDNGIGIEKAALDSIFDIFSQEMRAVGKTGLGIGLALVRRFIELHEGSVKARSEGPGHGSEFVVTLPLHREERQEEPDSSSESKRVLIVEDNPDNARNLKKIIEVEGGHDVRTTGNGQDAIRDALSFDPDVVLLDLGLPDMSGEVVARILRKRLPDTCIVALTGYSQPETSDGWYDHYMTKPVNLPALLRILSQCKPVAA